MQTKTVVILGMTGVAIALIYKNKERAKTRKGTFGEGYVAGWFTPGPFTIIASAGLVHNFT